MLEEKVIFLPKEIIVEAEYETRVLDDEEIGNIEEIFVSQEVNTWFQSLLNLLPESMTFKSIADIVDDEVGGRKWQNKIYFYKTKEAETLKLYAVLQRDGMVSIQYFESDEDLRKNVLNFQDFTCLWSD